MGISTLSSRLTFVTKIIFPIFWISAFGAGTFVMWAGKFTDRQSAPPPIEMKLAFLTAFIAGTLFFLWACIGLKEIRIDDRSIYISNYLKEISVPLGAIDDVTEYWWISPPLITLHFRYKTEFGNKVRFTPKRRPFMSWGAHPVVVELRRLAGISEAHR
jgi:hypothetical protein